jgi:ribosomal protein S19E (S16A)
VTAKKFWYDSKAAFTCVLEAFGTDHLLQDYEPYKRSEPNLVMTTKRRVHLYSSPADQDFWPTRSASVRRVVSEAPERNIGTAWRQSQSSNKSHVYGGLTLVWIYL